jgi:hypothetical protein
MDDEEMTPETPAEAAEDAAAKPLCSPNLLLTLQEAQGQHGLRHGDYARYRCVAGAPAARAASPHCLRVRTADARTAAPAVQAILRAAAAAALQDAGLHAQRPEEPLPEPGTDALGRHGRPVRTPRRHALVAARVRLQRCRCGCAAPRSPKTCTRVFASRR